MVNQKKSFIRSICSNQFLKKYIIPWGLFCLLAIGVAFLASWYKKQNAIPEWNPSILDFIPGQRTWLVLDIIDGDSVVIRYKGKMKAVQLLQVNAPDMGNPFYQESRDFLRNLIKDERVEMIFPEGHEFDTDFFGRYLAYIKVGKVNVNKQMIEKGYAKIEVALARGKREFDKRENIKKKDTDRDLARIKKIKM